MIVDQDVDFSSQRNSGVSFVLHTLLLEAEVVNTFLELRELVTITRANDLTSCIALGLIALAFRERETIPPPRLLWLRVSLTRNQLLSRELVIGKN